MGNYGHSPLSSRHGSQESLRHLSSMSSMNMIQTPTGNRDLSGGQKKKGIKSSLGRLFSKKDKVKGGKDTMQDSASIMSGLSMNMSDIDSNYDTMSISSRINLSGTTLGRQKKKYDFTMSVSSINIEILTKILCLQRT